MTLVKVWCKKTWLMIQVLMVSKAIPRKVFLCLFYDVVALWNGDPLFFLFISLPCLSLTFNLKKVPVCRCLCIFVYAKQKSKSCCQPPHVFCFFKQLSSLYFELWTCWLTTIIIFSLPLRLLNRYCVQPFLFLQLQLVQVQKGYFAESLCSTAVSSKDTGSCAGLQASLSVLLCAYAHCLCATAYVGHAKVSAEDLHEYWAFHSQMMHGPL